MTHTYSAGGIILNSKGDVLLIHEDGNFWGLPKGRIQPDEDALTAAKREIREESGLTNPTYICELGSYQRHPYNNGKPDMSELKTITLFLFRTDEGLADTNEENNETVWVAPEQAVTMLTELHDRQFFESKLREITAPSVCYNTLKDE